MSTQPPSGIPFAIADEQHALKLLELPTELLEILTRPDPPVLAIKSAVNSGDDTRSNGDSASSSSYAVLCTADKTFHLRQVQTSNSVFITQPSAFQHDADSLPQEGITAIAQCSATLELIPSEDSASSYLKNLLPLWTKNGFSAEGAQHTRDDFFNNIPLSDAEIHRAWVQVCAFELKTKHARVERSCFRPASADLLELWKAILTASSAEGIPICASFDVAALWRHIDDEGYPRSLFDAIVRRLSAGDRSVEDPHSGIISFDRATCVRWLATLVLEIQSQTSDSMPEAQFVEQWRDSLPEPWRADATPTAAEDLFVRPAPGIVAAKGSALHVGSDSSAPASKVRRWHEKFRSSRR